MSQLGTDIRGFLGNLLRDRAGNTLAIVAASTLPLLALVGGGIDISRGYMAKTQLQAACDAGVLAGRRAMAKSGEYSTKERAKANAMFDFNYDKASVQATKTTFVTQDNNEGQVTGTATTEMPTAVMRIFGKNEMNLAVDCMAELQLANVDVMFVLDSTGSMGSPIKSGQPTKIQGLRDAVRDFHSTLAAAVVDEETRVRYGFVPYSMTVNVSQLISTGQDGVKMPLSYIADSGRYSTREAYFNTPVYVPATQPSTTEEQTYGSLITSSNCNSYGSNSLSPKSATTSGTAPGDTYTYTYAFKSWTKSGSSSNGTCKRTMTSTKTTYTTEYQFTNWIFREANVNTSLFKTGATVSIAKENDAALVAPPVRVKKAGYYNPYDLVHTAGISGVLTQTARWRGCIEEADTVQTDDFDPVPDKAYDLDINLVPNSQETRWKPLLGDISFMRNSNLVSYTTTAQNPGSAPSSTNTYYRWSINTNPDPTYGAEASTKEKCPSPMLLFREIDMNGPSTPFPSDLNTYLNGLVAIGNTYHDIGMTWGGRLASPNGIFQENVNAGDDKNVSRHLIFMTDGTMEPTLSGYSAYGMERYSNRIAPSGSSTSQVTARHNSRFKAACDAVKAEGYTIYVIAFGTSLTSELSYCASGGRAYYSSDTTQLRNTFKFIASQVADLRLGK